MSITTWLKKHKTEVDREEQDLRTAIQLSLQFEQEQEAEERQLQQLLSIDQTNEEKKTGKQKQHESLGNDAKANEAELKTERKENPPSEKENDEEYCLSIDDMEAWLNSDIVHTPSESFISDPMRSSPASPLFFESTTTSFRARLAPALASSSRPFQVTERSREKVKRNPKRSRTDYESPDEDPLAAFVEPMIVRERVLPAQVGDMKTKKIETSEDFECPICLRFFPGTKIEVHAASCDAFEDDDAEDVDEKYDTYLSSPTRKNTIYSADIYGDEQLEKEFAWNDKKTSPQKTPGYVKPKTIAAAVAKAREAAYRKKHPSDLALAPLATPKTGSDYNYYATNDCTIEDEFGDAGLGGGTGQLAWESVGQARYSGQKMKLTSRFASLSVSAALLLQCGTFVQASPFFNHVNDVSTDTTCQGLVFEDATKHVIAWQAPQSSFQQVNITLVGEDNNSTNVAYIGTFAADRGASDEVPLSLNNHQPGEYHFHLAALGGTSPCEIDSVKFRIEKPKATTTTVVIPNSSTTTSANVTPTSATTGNLAGTPTATTVITDAQTTGATTGTPTPATTNTLGGAPTNLAVDDKTLDGLINSIQQNNKDASSNPATTSDDHINDGDLDKLLNEIKGQGTPSNSNHFNDQELESLMNDIKKGGSHSNADNDKAWDAMLDGVDEYLKPKKKPQADKNDHLNQVVSDMFDALKEESKSHKDEAPKAENPAPESKPDQNLESFAELIGKFDQEYKHYLENNKQSETETVTHKNEVNENETLAKTVADALHSNGFFTNEDRRTKGHSNEIPGLDQALEQLHANDAKAHYFTDKDERKTGHVNEIPGLNEAIEQLHSNEVKAQYFTNDDRRSGHLRARAVAYDTQYFTNEDQRSQGHVNEWIGEEDQYFTDDDRTKPHENDWVEESEALEEENVPDWSHQDDVTGWTVEEVAPSAIWKDNAEGLPDHSNEGTWHTDEYDPSAPVEVVEETADHYNDGVIIDHTNEGSFSAEEVDQVDEPSHEDLSPLDVWVEEKAGPEHYNDADWTAEEAAADDVQPSGQPASGEWHVEESGEEDSATTADASHLNEWIEDLSRAGPSNPNDWHVNVVSADEDWHDADEATPTEDHENVASDWEEEFGNEFGWHADEVPVTEDRQWQDDSAFQSHSNQGEWIAEEAAENVAHEDSAWHEVDAFSP
ncbi:hypothetical protein DFQ28_002766 [Apophysomyces sp. BC1034]|nr:hypothetical protein DFQ30_007580 [Apophysomyces sp. BC1015]KAG0193891.1 hypothetical protein DFQ28_002766 [Apophysomyces sp. BC1034]